MLHLLYILAFTVLAFLAVGNLIRSLMALGIEAQRGYHGPARAAARRRPVSHPELLDDDGNLIEEPFLVMRSISVDDARAQLDQLYKSSPGPTAGDVHDDAP